MRTLLTCLTLFLAGSAVAERWTLIEAKAIYTVNAKEPKVQAFVFDSSGHIVATGQSDVLVKRYPDALIQRFPDRSIVPGMIDAHGHLLGLGQQLTDVDLVGTRSIVDVIERLRERAAELPKGSWLIGRGWDQNDWSSADNSAAAFPNAADLDAAFPDQPVWLERVDGHAGWANAAAMQRSVKALDGTWQPEGGVIQRGPDKRPNGIFIDAAMALIGEAVPVVDSTATRQLLVRAVKHAASLGLTGVHDAGTSLPVYQELEQMAGAGALPIRVYAMADGDSAALRALCQGGLLRHASGRLQMRAVKLYIDGALGSRGAALLAPYSDDPKNSGLLFQQLNAFTALVGRAMHCGLQVNTHAIGDRGNRVVLDAYEQALKRESSAKSLRHRVEHAQIINIKDIPRFAQLGLIASMQPTHATSDMPWAGKRLGLNRLGGAYAWQTMLTQNVPLALGSDFPVESANPWLGFYAAVTRADLNGMPKNGWLPKEKLTREQALYGFTMGAAYAGFMERQVGSIEIGKRADFVVLDRDVMSVADAELPATKVLATVVGGETVYQAD